MARLKWDAQGERRFENNVDKGVLYPIDDQGDYNNGVVWNGLTSIKDSPTGADPQKFYADGILYASLRAAEEYGATVEAFTYPDAFALCDGSAEIIPGVYIGQQDRKAFGLSYRSFIGTDLNPNLGYKIHIVWNLTANPSEKTHDTINDSPEIANFSWEMTASPVAVTGHKPTSTMEIDSTKVSAEKLKKIEDILYGTDTVEGGSATEARLPSPDELITILTQV